MANTLPTRNRCRSRAGTSAVSVDLDLAQQPEIAQHLARTKYDTGQWIIRNGDGQARFFAYPLIEVFDQGAAPRQNDSAIADIRAQLRRRAFERNPHRSRDCRYRL